MNLSIETLDRMTPAEEKRFWTEFERTLANDDGQAAHSHLAAGRPIYYGDDRYQDGYVREWPDGRLELVTVDNQGDIVVIQPL